MEESEKYPRIITAIGIWIVHIVFHYFILKEIPHYLFVAVLISVFLLAASYIILSPIIRKKKKPTAN